MLWILLIVVLLSSFMLLLPRRRLLGFWRRPLIARRLRVGWRARRLRRMW